MEVKMTKLHYAYTGEVSTGIVCPPIHVSYMYLIVYATWREGGRGEGGGVG